MLKESKRAFGEARATALACLLGITVTSSFGCSDHGANGTPQVARRAAALVAAEGDVTVTGPSQVNAYAALAADTAAGSTSLLLQPGGAARFTAGDLILLWQAQGAAIDSTDDATYGGVTGYGNTGRYELTQVTAVASATNTLTIAGPGLRFPYTASAHTQVVRVPSYANLTVAAGARLSAPAWDGVSGGVIALHVRDTLTLNGSVDASGLGFRGGVARSTLDNGVLNIASYRTSQPQNGGAKGESVAGFGAEYDVIGGRFGRGAAANAGGGGNAHNGGGGGGANVAAPGMWSGQGVMDASIAGGATAWLLDPQYVLNGNRLTQSPGGGRGGYSYSNSDQNALLLGPGQAAWAGDNRRERGGLGGHPLPVDPLQRLFFGGGGGAGDANNAHGGDGGSGGGLIVVVAHRITGNGQFLALGSAGGIAPLAPNDAPGGGGGGGAILLLADLIDGVSALADGGLGGSQQQDQTVPEAEGPGGGGGGGLVASHGGLASVSVAGGAAGLTDAPSLREFPVNGATRGAPGVATGVPDDWGGVIYVPGDLGVSASHTGAIALAGGTATFVLDLTNAGPNQVPRVTLNTTVGGTATLDNVSWTCSASGTSRCAQATGTGLPQGPVDIVPGDTVSFTVTGTVASATTAGTITINATAVVPPGYDDPRAANDTATDIIPVGAAADLAATISIVPPTVVAGSDVRLDAAVSNGGPSPAAAVSLTVNAPAGATVRAASGAGWTCALGPQTAICTRAALAAGTTAGVSVQLTAPAALGTGTVTATAASVTTDPSPANNTASASLTSTVNHLPTAQNDSFTVLVGSVGNRFDVLANDTTAPDAGESLTITAVSATAHGTAAVSAGAILYTPAAGYAGADALTYTIDDGHGGVATGMVSIQITAGGQGGGGQGGATGGGGQGGATGGNGGVSTGGRGGLGGGAAGAGGLGARGGMGGGGGANPSGGNGGTPTAGRGGGQGQGGSGGGQGGRGGGAGQGVGGQPSAGGQAGIGGQAGVAMGGAAHQGGASGHGGSEEHGGAAGLDHGIGGAGGGLGGFVDVDHDGLNDDGVGVRGGGCSCEVASGSTPRQTAVGVLFALFSLRRRRRPGSTSTGARRTPPRAPRKARASIVLALVVLGAVLGASSSATGQTVATPATSIPVERFRWSLDRQGLLNVEWGRTPDAGALDLALWGSYANDPLVLVRASDGARLGALIHHRVDGALLAAWAPADRLQLGLVIPWIAYQRGERDIAGATVSTLPALATTGLGDVALVPKVGLIRGAGDIFGLAVLATVTFPTSGGKNDFGEKGVTAAPELAASAALGDLRFAANVGYRWRKERPRLGDLQVEDEAFGSLGVGYRFGAAEGPRRPFEFDLTGAAASSAAHLLRSRNQTPLEADAAFQVDVLPFLTAMMGAGLGFGPGFGDPDWRAVAGLRFTHATPAIDDDPDRDGVRGDADRCPRDPEDRDGFQDGDGCPDLDDDRDGVADRRDRCPMDPGPAANHGCPDSDRDLDGIVDRLDRCPREAEDKDDFQDQDGCPDPDNDADGVLDADDRCPSVPGAIDNQGCPDRDRDGDGIIDRLDNCPDEPGDAANNGCKKRQLARLTARGIEIVDTVYFETDKAVIQRKSFPLLDNVAAVIGAHPEIEVLRVEGHTDAQGDDAHNQKLSERRAAAVAAYLAKKGIDAGRLNPRGYGETQPIADNKTRAGRAQNRRVVFVIERAGAGS